MKKSQALDPRDVRLRTDSAWVVELKRRAVAAALLQMQALPQPQLTYQGIRSVPCSTGRWFKGQRVVTVDVWTDDDTGEETWQVVPWEKPRKDGQ